MFCILGDDVYLLYIPLTNVHIYRHIYPLICICMLSSPYYIFASLYLSTTTKPPTSSFQVSCGLESIFMSFKNAHKSQRKYKYVCMYIVLTALYLNMLVCACIYAYIHLTNKYCGKKQSWSYDAFLSCRMHLLICYITRIGSRNLLLINLFVFSYLFFLDIFRSLTRVYRNMDAILISATAFTPPHSNVF